MLGEQSNPVLKSYNKRNNNDLFDTTNRVNESSVDSYLLVSLSSSISSLTKNSLSVLIGFDFREHSSKIDIPSVTLEPIASAFICKSVQNYVRYSLNI